MESQLVVARGDNVLLKAQDPLEAEVLTQALQEILGSWTMASPTAGRYLMRVVDLLARHVHDLDDLSAALDEHAIWAAQHNFAEAAALLLEASDSIRSAGDRIFAANNPQGGFHA
jgi:hypothetical protein